MTGALEDMLGVEGEKLASDDGDAPESSFGGSSLGGSSLGGSSLDSASVTTFLEAVAVAQESALVLDFDGTLAPFRVDPSKVRPWAGVRALLEKIQLTERTRLAVVTGRPVADVLCQLNLSRPIEIWGLHGAERLYLDGRIDLQLPSTIQMETLQSARRGIAEWAKANAVQLRVEEKSNAVVVHWRGRSASVIAAVKQMSLAVFGPLAKKDGMTLLQFDGGIELRAGRDKGDAVRTLQAELQKDVPMAYLGDDTTDEDAFRALDRQGLSILVRRKWRPGAARVWLRPASCVIF